MNLLMCEGVSRPSFFFCPDIADREVTYYSVNVREKKWLCCSCESRILTGPPVAYSAESD